ncbi:MAG: hypothetical protein LBD94_00240, partial [Rickettsiales bacterium]|nr:hypothetical protein [Rickettsiales bacterium]
MRKYLPIFLTIALFVCVAQALTSRNSAGRSANAPVTSKLPAETSPTAAIQSRATATAVVTSRSNTATATRPTSSRQVSSSRQALSRATAVKSRTTKAAAATRKTNIVARTAISTGGGRSRAAVSDAVASTRTGASYEKCKDSYFTCMDQFCAVKNENYRRCSCSDKIHELEGQQQVLESAAEKVNEFNSGLDAVGMTVEQATAMKKASEGELAMGEDQSSGKRLLSAIMNSISGSGETKVGGGTLEKLNSINFEGDSSAFGGEISGQQLASYNGKTLYTAIYGQCRNVVRTNCTDDALQRAVTAYLMAIENDCGTVSKMIEENRKKMTSAVRESGAMLELARVENRQNHNSADAAECLNAVEKAIKDEQVCGENYKKCLDNGEFINKDTGKPFSGVANFYELANLLTFDSGTNIADQKLASIPTNKPFVQNFVSRNKKFAEPALDKCTEIADT